MFHFSEKTVKEAFENHEGKCLVCKAELNPENPESFYTHSYGDGKDTAENCFLLCPECHEKFLHSRLKKVDYPETKHGFYVKKYKSPAAAAVLGAIFPTFGMFYVGARFFFLNLAIYVALVCIQNNLVMPTYETAIAEVVVVNIAYHVYAAILGYKMAKYQRNLLKAYVRENDLDPNCYEGPQ